MNTDNNSCKKLFERWDDIGFYKNLKGNLNENVTKLYEHQK